MAAQFTLPENKKQAAEVIHRLVELGKSKRNPISVRWWLTNAYLQGYRDFSNIDYTGGTVSVSYMDESGILRFKLEDIVSMYQAQIGRLMSLNLSPAVSQLNFSLDGMRKTAIAQVVLNEAFSEDKVRRLALDLYPPLLMYGTIGLGLWIESEDSMGIEVIPPWELMPIPIDVSGPHDVRGLIRVRYVPVEWIKGLTQTPGRKSEAYKKVDFKSIPSGQIPISGDAAGEGLLSMTSAGGGFFVKATDAPPDDMKGRRKKKDKDETNKNITQLVEVWTETSDHYLSDYAIYAGMSNYVELYRNDHSADKYHMPIRTVRDVVVGGFWGRSYVEQLMPVNQEIEYGLSSMFQAMSDYDLYGIQLWPTSLGNPVEAERGQDGIKRVRYEPDYSTPEVKPENIMPNKSQLPHVQGVKIGLEILDRIANQPTEMMRGNAPGRVDSAAGLGALYEASGIPLSPTAKNIAEGVSGVYRAMLRILKDIWTDQKVVNITKLDDTMAGISLDAQTGTINLAQNAIPFPDEVSVTVASEVPVSKEQQKFELKEALAQGRITLQEYSFEVRRKGLDLPVGLEREWHNYRRAMLENILLFGDGEVPGSVIVSDRDIHRIHLDILDAFMARPEFYAASSAVRDSFVKHYEEHRSQLGGYPGQLEYPEEAAEDMLEQTGPTLV